MKPPVKLLEQYLQKSINNINYIKLKLYLLNKRTLQLITKKKGK